MQIYAQLKVNYYYQIKCKWRIESITIMITMKNNKNSLYKMERAYLILKIDYLNLKN